MFIDHQMKQFHLAENNFSFIVDNDVAWVTVILLNPIQIFIVCHCRKSEESSSSKKSDSASSDSDLPAEYLNSPLSRENQVRLTNHTAFTSILFPNTRLQIHVYMF